MQALFQPKNFAEVANFLMLAKPARFAVDGVALMQAAAGGAALSFGSDPLTQFTLGLPFPAVLTLLPSSSFLVWRPRCPS
jgi:hypothetical protein